MKYGNAPERMGRYQLDWREYMHYMYLPIIIPGTNWPAIPKRLMFARDMILDALEDQGDRFTHVYITARRGYATPGNPLNRPGWHADGFGTDDINYVWTDRYPTLFAIQDFENISTEHGSSMQQFEDQIKADQILTYADRELLRLDSSVIHAAPEIPAPGGERGFFKISFSNSRYDLAGNSHNHRIDYDWPMFDRASQRNDPAHANSDSSTGSKQ